MADGIRFPDDMVGKDSPLHDDDKVLLSDSQDAKKSKWWSLAVIKSWLYGFFAKIDGDNVTDANKTAWQSQLEIALLNDQLKDGTAKDVHSLTDNGVYATDATTTNLPVGISKIGVLNVIKSGTTKYLNYTTYESGAFKRWSKFYDGATWSIWQALETELGESKQNISTGLLYGGELSINTDPTKFNIASGKGVIVNSYTNPATPTITPVSWVLQEALTVDNLATQLVTWVYVDSSSTVHQASEPLSSEDSRNYIEIGILVHSDLATITSTSTIPNWVADSDLKVRDLSSSLGSRIITEGNKITPNGANLKIDKSIGKTFGIGVNYDINKKDPNIRMDAQESAITFLTAKGGTPSGIGSSSDIDTIYYDPEGIGVLVEIPDEFVSVHGVFFSSDTGITIVHYGQFIYDSIREAIDAWDKQEYNVIPELEGVALAGVIAFVKGATDLSDHTQAMFVKTGKLGIDNNNVVAEYSRFSSISKTLSGMTYNRPSITLRESGGNVYADVERLGGGDLIFIFGEREYVLNCTTGAGIGGKATILLTDGSDTVPQKNYVYATPTIGNGHAQLNSSTSRPTGTFGYVADFSIQASGSGFTNNGPLQSRRWTDAKEFDGRGVLSRTNERFRVLSAEWEYPGVLQSIIIDSGVSPYSVNATFTAGKVWQKHLQNFPALNISVDGIYISNHPTTPYLKITDLNDVEALQTSTGVSLADTRFNWVFAGVINMETAQCKMFLTVPIDSYATDDGAVSDSNSTAVTSFHPDFKGNVFLVARLPMRHRSNSGGTYENLALSKLGTDVIDLRGQSANTSGGASSPPLGSSFEDVLFNIYNAVGGFQFRFDASNLTANRILTAPDQDGTIALISDITNAKHYQLYQPDGTNPFVYTDNGGALHIDGDIVQSGSAYETHVEQVFTKDDLIITRDGAVAGLGVGEYTGFQAKLYDGVNDGQLVFDKDGWARVGDVGSLQKLATIEETPTDTYIAYWNLASNQLKTKQLAAADINDFDTEVSNNSSVAANTAKISSQWENVTGGINYSSGNVGIGVISADYTLHVVDEATITTGSQFSQRNVILSNPSGPSTVLHYGAYFGIDRVSGNPQDGGSLYAIATAVDNSGSGLVDNLYGSFQSTRISGSGNVTNAYGIQVRHFNSGAGTLTNMYGIYLDTPTMTGGAITNKWGIYQEDPTSNNFFGGNVGIGVTIPSQKLEVAGNAIIASTSPYLKLEDTTTSEADPYLVANTNNFYINFDTPSVTGAKFILASSGVATFSSTVTATNFILSSDIRLKDNIKAIKTKNIDAVELKQFVLKSDDNKRLRYGVIAQDLEQTHPEMVHVDDRGYKQVDYIDFLIAKARSSESRLLKLEARLLKLEARLLKLEK